jgi:rfaE bifunctional protein nucleotidyltransferase chain/domain
MSTETKIYELEELLKKLEEDRHAGKKIVFTNGCFDILHRGHATYLRKARSLGDLLIIGLNTDASVKRLKGESRPINHEDDRAYLLESLECVDYVVKFGEDTPHELLSLIKPDILVKGGDYKLEDVVGREFSKEVILIDFVDGYSTTKTIQQMAGSGK